MATPQALARAKEQAKSTVAKALVRFSTSKSMTWDILEQDIGVPIPALYKRQALTYTTLKYGWGSWYANSVEARLKEDLETKPVEKAQVLRIYELDKSECTRLGTKQLAPEQDAVYKSVVRDMFVEKRVDIVMNDGTMGSGKTYLGIALVKYILDNDLIAKSGRLYGFAPILVVTVKSVMESWSRHFEAIGLGKYLGNKIVITSYSALTSYYGKIFTREEENPLRPSDPPKIIWNLGTVPYFMILDESHKTNRDSRQTRTLLSAFTTVPLAYRPRLLCLSATPWVVPSNIRFFATVTGATVGGVTCTENNFNQWIKLVSDDPDRPDEKAAIAIRKIFSPNIYSFPRVKWDHKAINSIMLCDFSTEADRAYYIRAYERYLEKCQKLGKNTEFGKFEQHIAIQQFRVAVEPIRADQIVDRCHEHIKSGVASPVIGCAFRNTVIRAVFRLIQLGYKRDDISIIWGGREEIKSKLVLTPAQMNEIILKTSRGEPLTKHDIKRLETTIMFREDKLSFGETTDADTLARHERLKAFGLAGHQSENQRQLEIDRFQSGKSKICIFTLAAGGIGLSLDHATKNLLPRIGYFTPTYSGAEFKQALGRLPRRFTLSDTYQYIVGMRGTIEETHVMPLIDSKLRCLAKITGSDFDIINTLSDATVFERAMDIMIRTQDEVLKDSESDDTQIHTMGDSDRESSDDNDDDE